VSDYTTTKRLLVYLTIFHVITKKQRRVWIEQTSVLP